MRVKVVYFTPAAQSVIDLVTSFAPAEFQVDGASTRMPDEEKQQLVKDADFIMIHGTLSSDVIRAASKVKLIQCLSVGYEHVDLELLKDLGIPYANIGSMIAKTVAEMAVALMLAVYRKLVALDVDVRAGKWNANLSGLDSYELHGKTVGIVGFGNIGQAVAGLLQGFENNILYYDVMPHPAAEAKFKARKVTLEKLVKSADIVTLHTVLDENTRGMIGVPEFALMKRSAIVVNTCRGPVIDETALIGALKEGRIGGAGLDVFEQEPVATDNPMLGMGNVVVTPHAAGTSIDSWPRRAKYAYDNFARVLEGREPLSVIRMGNQ